MYLNDINARLGEIDAELEAIAALTDPTEDDAARAEALTSEIEELRQARQEAQERAVRIAEAHRKAKEEGRQVAGSSFHVMKKVEPYDADARNMSDGEARDAARAILDRPEARHVSDAGKEKAHSLINTMDSRLARWAVSTSRPEYRSAFAKYLAGRENLLTNDERRAVEAVDFESRTYMGLTGANGGYAVPMLLDPSVIYTGDGTANPIRQISRVVTGISNKWEGLATSGISASWDQEGAVVSDDSPDDFSRPTVEAHKGQAFVAFSVELEGDWTGLATEVGMLFAEAKDELETSAFATGSGSNQPTGIITALVAASGSVANVQPGTDGELHADDIRNLFGKLGPRYRQNASWVMSLDTLNEIRALGDDKLSNQTVDLTAGYNFSILGRPVYEDSGFPDFTGTTGVANIMVVGDFRNYVVFDRVGARVEAVQHVFDPSTGRPTGQRGLVYWFRTGANVVNPNAFRLLRNT